MDLHCRTPLDPGNLLVVTPWSLKITTLCLAAQATALLPCAMAEPSRDIQEHIVIPIRWCAVRGSPAVKDPAGSKAATTDAILRTRHGRASLFVWMPEAGISFRSALTADAPHDVAFPIIDDPNPPKSDGSGGAGVEGDILDPNHDRAKVREISKVVASCGQAWQKLEDRYGTNFEGIIGVNIRRFVKPDGTPSQLLGIGSSMHTVPRGKNKCEVPLKLESYEPLGSNDGWVTIVDDRFTSESDPEDSVLAHELGHVMFLGHGNGFDDPRGDPPRTNRRYDAYCDRHEEVNAHPLTLMKPKRPVPDQLTEYQRISARAAARVTVGALTVELGDLKRGYLISDDEVDKVADVKDPSIDLRTVGIKVNARAGVSIITYRLVGRIPSRASHRFLIFADMDADPKTGGAPAVLGFRTPLQGVEFISEIVISGRKGDGKPWIVPTVWLFRSGEYVKVPPNPRIRADVHRALDGHTGKPLNDVVTLQLPHDLVVPRPVLVRAQAVAERIDGEQDRIPDDPKQGRLIYLSMPTAYPLCRPFPYRLQAGDRYRLEGSGFAPKQVVKVLLDKNVIAEGPVGAQGNFVVQLSVPENARPGVYLLVVEEQATARRAYCSLAVGREALESAASRTSDP